MLVGDGSWAGDAALVLVQHDFPVGMGHYSLRESGKEWEGRNVMRNWEVEEGKFGAMLG